MWKTVETGTRTGQKRDLDDKVTGDCLGGAFAALTAKKSRGERRLVVTGPRTINHGVDDGGGSGGWLVADGVSWRWRQT